MLLAAAKYLAESGDFDGTVYFVFQPSEEDGRGALSWAESRGLAPLVAELRSRYGGSPP